MEPRLLVGLRGLTRGNIHWGVFPDVLKKVMPQIHFLTLEMAGNGTRSQEISHVDPAQAVEDLRHQLQDFKKTHPEFTSARLHVLAISLGGMLALKWAEMYPGEIDDLVVVNSSLNQLSPFYKRLNPKNYMRIFKTLGFGSVPQQEELILRLTSNDFSQTSRHLPSFIQAGEKNKFQLANFFRQLMLASRIKIEKSVSLRPVFICSEKDRLVSCRCSEDLKNYFSGDLYSNPLAGHDLALDDPSWLAEKINSLQSPRQNH